MTDTYSEFGDIEADDAWDADPTIAPEQVTYRLHELRTEVERLGGGDAPNWEDLTDAEQELALAIGQVVVDWIADREPDRPDDTARQIHNVRVYLSRGVVHDWDDLAPDERQIGIDLVTLVIAWLEREGPR